MTTLQDLLKQSGVLKYKIKANTDKFYRKDESIAVLAAATANKIVEIDKKEFENKTKEDKISIAKKKMKQHYEKFGGKLPVFGEITSYSFYLDNEIIIGIEELYERLSDNSK